MPVVGLISPGKMGASAGAAAARSGAAVIWAGKGRSRATKERARTAGLSDCGTTRRMVQEADIILSICPPHEAVTVAHSVSRLSFKGIYADCNAIAPDKSRNIAGLFPAGQFVDGGIVGGPAWEAENGTRLYLAGRAANRIAALFADSPLHATLVSEHIGAASALKMAFAAYTKGSTALLTAILAVAEKEGVRPALERQWGRAFTAQTHDRVTGNTAKAWRFAGEMREIAGTFEAAGLPCGFHNAAAEVFERLAAFKDKPANDVEQLLAVLLRDAR